MALCQVNWFSNVINKMVVANVIVPDGPGPFATFYLLHGLSDDHSAWLRRTRIEMYAAAYPMIVVMPDGFRGFYTNNNQGPAYGQYIGQELCDFIERTFHARPERAARMIGGLSMGGYGALRIALGYPDRFISATSQSGAVMRGSGAGAGQVGDEFSQIFGPSPEGSEHDLVHLAHRAAAAGELPHMRLDCGTSDFLLEQNRDFHRRLRALKIPHEYDEFPGDHNWDYWDLHVRQALRFHAQVMKLI